MSNIKTSRVKTGNRGVWQGKGTWRRPTQVSAEAFALRWCVAFEHDVRDGVCQTCAAKDTVGAE